MSQSRVALVEITDGRSRGTVADMMALSDPDADLIEEVDVFLGLREKKLGFDDGLPLPPGYRLSSGDRCPLLMPRIGLIAAYCGAPGFVPPSPALIDEWESRALAARGTTDSAQATVVRASFEVLRKHIRQRR